MLEKKLKALPSGAKVLDYGCYGWDLYHRASAIRDDLEHFSADVQAPSSVPQQITFGNIDLKTVQTDFADDSFDLVVASHVIEHTNSPIEMFAELARTCKPGGFIYLEAPSDKACQVVSDPDYGSHTFFSFWDDPTHTRPWTPAAFYRLAKSFGLEVEDARYLGSFGDKVLWPFVYLKSKMTGSKEELTPALWRAKQWACAGVFSKPENLSGKPEYKYISFKKISGAGA